jgi:hypothetical protein
MVAAGEATVMAREKRQLEVVSDSREESGSAAMADERRLTQAGMSRDTLASGLHIVGPAGQSDSQASRLPAALRL